MTVLSVCRMSFKTIVVLAAVLAGLELWDAPAVALGQTPGAAYRRLIDSGRLPEERLGLVVGLLCQRGNADDLAYVLQKCTAEDGMARAGQVASLKALVQAAQNRKLKPSGDLSQLEVLLTAKDPQVSVQAVKLAGLWKVASLLETLEKLALGDSKGEVQQAAIEAIGQLGGPESQKVLARFSRRDQPLPLRFAGAAALTQVDRQLAARRAAEALADATPLDEVGGIIDAFLAFRDGPAQLGQALNQVTLQEDVAKLALRHMYAIGRTDAALTRAFSEAAGIAAEPKPPSQQEIARLVQLVESSGDPQRGEMVFRRKELSCFNCHALSQAGGNIGPDLSAVGGSSPVDYLLNSILQPALAVKEQYKMVTVVTAEGKVHQGLVIEETDDRLVLRTAEGQEVEIPADEENEIETGGSLMPKGLTRFTTEQELVDLVQFLSMLGRPGEYAINSRPTIQRWRLLKPVPQQLVDEVPDEEAFSDGLTNAPTDHWGSVYAKVAGSLPLAELVAQAESKVLYLYGEIEITHGGPIGVKLSSTQGVTVWFDGRQMPTERSFTTAVELGKHRLTLRVDTTRAAEELGVEFFSPDEAVTEFAVVGGP